MAEREPATASEAVANDGSSLVFVLGPGRSGTSTMAGALAFSGYTVPGSIKGNETNPLGFFEPRWVVNFHRKYLRKAHVGTLDTEPAALTRLERAVSGPQVREELTTWLRRRLRSNQRLVIKDPRMVWFKGLWLDVAQELGVEPSFVIMLRHPAEVSSSRSTYYEAREVAAVAGWINVALVTERLTRGSRRAIVHYPRLTADWRPELVRLRDVLGLSLEPAPEVSPHPVDDFIDPKLRRMNPDWANVAAPAHLQEIAERTFVALSSLADDGESAEIYATLDGIATDYATMHADAVDMLQPTLRRTRADARRQALRKAGKKRKKKTAPAEVSLRARARARLRRLL